MGYLKVKSPLEKPIKIFNVDWHNTLEELNERIKVNRERYMTDGFCSPGSGDGILEESVKLNTIRITACPNGFYHNGNHANIDSDIDLPVSMTDSTYYVYLQAQELEEPFEIPEDPFNQYHIYSSFKPDVKLLPVLDDHKHDPNDGIYIGQVHIVNGMASVKEKNNNRRISQLRPEALPGIENKFSDMFRVGIDGKIVLNTQLYRLMDIGVIEKTDDDSLYINTKYEDESKSKYNIVTINNAPIKFPGGDIKLSKDDIGGRVGSIDINFFKENKALIFAIDHNNKQTYGIYPKPIGRITGIQYNTDKNSVVEVENVNLMNPLGVFRIYNSKGESQIKQGLARSDNSITLAGKIGSGFNNDAKIEQIGNFKLYKSYSGEELYKGLKGTYKYAFIGYYGEVDSKGKFSFVGKYSFDNTFETNKLGKVTIRDEAITANKIANDTITADKIANDTITANKIANDTITADKIANDTITADKIKNGTITADKIANDTITANKIANDTITADKIANDTITADKIKNGTITANKIAKDTITANKIANDTITADKIANDTITADKIKNGTITANKIAKDTITANKIANDTITANKIANDTITADKIANDTITADKIANDTITANKIKNGTIIADKIKNGTITANKIKNGTITANKIKNGTIIADKIKNGTITANKIKNGTITADKIAKDTITANKIAKDTITADKIKDKTITPPKLNYQYAKIWDEKPSGTDGGKMNTKAWNIRDLNKIETNIDGLTLSRNRFTMPAGIYKIQASAPAHDVNRHKIRLRTIDSNITLLGTSEFATIGRTQVDYPSSQSCSFLMGVLNTKSLLSFLIEHYIESIGHDQGNQLGVASKTGAIEIYTQVLIEKVG